MDFEKVTAAVLGVLLAIGGWVFRTILTNNKRLELLEQAIALRAEERAKSDARVEAALDGMAHEIKDLSLKIAKMEGANDA